MAKKTDAKTPGNALAVRTKNWLMKPQVAEDAPSFAVVPAGESDGTEGMGDFLRPQRIKFVQALTDSAVKALMPEGTMYLSPSNVPILEPGEGFIFVPLLWWPTWEIHNPAGTKPFIVERSYDRDSEIGRRSRDEKLRDGELNGHKVKYVESLNFIILPLMPDTPINPAVISFAKGEHRTGTHLINLVKMRTGVHMVGCCFEATSTTKDNGKGQKWTGLSIANPTDPSHRWVDDPDLYHHLHELHNTLKAHIEDLEYDDTDEVAENGEGEFA